MWLLVMAAFFLASAAVAFGPEGLLGSSPATTAVKTAHLLFFATSLGATVWAILVSGLVMFLYVRIHALLQAGSSSLSEYFFFFFVCVCGLIILGSHLPRHVMGRLRGKVFPACFKLNAACTAVSAAAFAWLHYPWKATPAVERRQLGLLVATVGFDLANLFLLAPKTLKVH
nr:uncharacterized protein LOC109743983 [Aegilops tauschii subsp. strangulata]